MMISDFSRRKFMASAAALALIASAPKAFALNESEARSLIDKAVADINRVINSGQSAKSMYGSFEKIFAKYADVSTIARSALGPPARSASSSQIRSFTKAFSGYMARKYGKRFREFVGGSIEVTGSRKVKSFQEVKAVAKLKGQSPICRQFYGVGNRSGSDKFFDLLIEGISLLKSERAEIGAMLDKRKGNIDALIKDLQKAG